MNVTPKTEAEVSNLWTAGPYEFEIEKAFDTLSKKGNEMIEADIRVHHEDGRSKVITDYIMEAVAYKLRHFAYCVGVGDDYENGGILPSKLVGRTGTLKLKIEPENNGFPAKNSVADYVVPDGARGSDAKPNVVAAKAQAPLDMSDEIPF